MTLLVRRREPELMDQPDLAPPAHDAALAGLERINRWSAADTTLRGPVLALAKERRAEGRLATSTPPTPPTPLTLLDVACGGGDVPIALQLAARREGLALDITAIDRSPQAVAHARAAAERRGADLAVAVRDACDGRPLPPADVVSCSLFLHHLDADAAVALLAAMGAAARRLLLVADLRRTVSGLLLALAVPRLLSRSAVVHADAPASARAAWSPSELAQLAARAGLAGARVRRRFPQRMLLTWTPP
jgi:SAM-dependent methyltransferase